MTSNPNPDDFLNGLKTYCSSEGLKKFLHGNIYQLKLLMLCAYRGWENSYTFRLATEMTDAGKFDDVVIWYKNENTDLVRLKCVQVKHSWDFEKKIRWKDLLDVKNGDYSLEKYFNSYRRIKEKLVNNNGSSELDSCIIWTNIPLDVKDAKNKVMNVGGNDEKIDIFVEKVGDMNEFQRILNSGDSTGELYRLLSGIDENPGVYERLKNLTDAHVLAKKLASCIYEKEEIPKEGIIWDYHPALATYVIDSKKNNQEQEDNKPAFYNSFEMCAEDTDEGRFKKYFLEECRELIVKEGRSGTRPTDDDVWSKIKDKLKESEIFPTFGTKFKARTIPIPLEDIKNFSKEFSKLIQYSQLDPNAIVVDRQKVAHSTLGKNINALLGTVLEVRGKKIKFKEDFFKDNGKLREDIKSFRNKLRDELGEDKFKDLENSHIEIRNPYELEKKFQCGNKLPGLSDITQHDRDIEEFLKKFFLAVGQPNEIKLGISINKQIREHEKLNRREAAFVNGLFQKKMLNWLKVKGKKPENEVRYFTDKDVERFFEKVLNKNKIGEGPDPIYTRLCTDSQSEEIADSEED